MAEAQLNVMDLTAAELVATATGIANALKGNADFPTPTPSLAELEEILAELAQAEKAHHQDRQRAKESQAARDLIADRLRLALTEEVAYVQEASGGDLAKILSANLHVEEETRLFSFGAAGDVEVLTASAGDQAGEIDLAWDPAPRASGYEVEIAYDLHGEGPWEQIGATTKSKITLEKLARHTVYWFRVRAINDRSPGDWSEPVMKLAP
jgi:hypothetical protein